MKISAKNLGRDFTAGIVVYLVALPLCLGIALASDAPIASGLIAGIVGGILIGALSGSHTSVAGPAAGLAAVVASQIVELGSFQAFLVAVVLAGTIQVVLGIMRAGFIAFFFPSSVIKGLLAAIGVILILKQVPHLVGHDADVEGEMAFSQPDGQNTFSELFAAAFDIQLGAAAIGLLSTAILFLWERVAKLKNGVLPGPLVVVLVALGLNRLLESMGSEWAVAGSHLVQLPSADGPMAFGEFVTFPDWSVLSNPAVYMAGFTLATVASLETLLNLDAVDQLDPAQRRSPPNRELVAQGVGNMLAGMIGGLPVTSVIVRSSVNINFGNKTKLSTIFHGFLLFGSIMLVPEVLNSIPLSALAAILFVTGFKLAKPTLFRQMWLEGRQQFLPFIVTVAVIVLTDLLTGVLVGLGVALTFILHSNFRRPLRTFRERHMDGEVLRIELANQVSFLNRASLEKTLRQVPRGGRVLMDARNTDYIDPDILDLIHEFRQKTAPAHNVQLSLLGFKDEYAQLPDEICFIDYSTRELQDSLGPQGALEILKQGNARFRRGEHLTRNLRRQMEATAPGQAPLAVVLSCIDSRAPAEHVFDLGIGDIFSVRIAGNIARKKVLGSIEYSCAVAGAKLIVVMGHTSCGAVTAAVDLKLQNKSAAEATGCANLDAVTCEIQKSIGTIANAPSDGDAEKHSAYVNRVAQANVRRTVEVIRSSPTIGRLLREGTIDIVGAMYDVRTGAVDFLEAADGKSTSADDTDRGDAVRADA